MTTLALLEAALEASRPGRASEALLLDQLVAAWRSKPAPAIADLVDAASLLCASQRPSLVGDTAAHQEAWLAVAREGRPADLERLLEALVVERAHQRTLERIDALGLLPPNPRLTTGLLHRLERRALGDRSWWYQVEKVLLGVGDGRLAVELSRRQLRLSITLRQGERTIESARKLPTIVLTDRESEISAAIANALTERRAAIQGAKRSGDDLLAAVYDSPDDDGARLVYADWLSQAGDPRGEFIVLQYQRRDGTISREGAAREKALLKQYVKAWLGPMDKLVRQGSVRFERGFPASVRFVSDLPLKATSPREWATVTEIDLCLTALSADGTLWLTHSGSLRSVDAILGARPEFFRRLLSGENEVGQPVDPERHGALLDRLRRLGGRGAPRVPDLEALLGLLDRAPVLDEIHWLGGDDTTIPLLVWALQNAPAHLARFVHATQKAAFALERGEEGLFDRLVMPPKPADWRDVAERVAAKGLLREVVIPAKTDDASAAALDAACARSGVDVRRGT